MQQKINLLNTCIEKNYQAIASWAKESACNCYRLYDKELSDYPLAIDFYAGRFCVHYTAANRMEKEAPEHIVTAVSTVLSQLFTIDPSSIFWRTRTKSKESRQYEKKEDGKNAASYFFIVKEYGVKFKVNLQEYIDTGLFLDHRETRQKVASCAVGKRLLNLFAYTCSFSVQAAAAGAHFTKSVDLSNTYCRWGAENFILNNLSLKNNPIIRADCLLFLDKEIKSKEKYDVIVIDPPTISRSKKMSSLFDVQVGYIPLILKSATLLLKGGTIFFSSNSRKFVFDPSHFPACIVKEITAETIPKDFRDKNIHRCWEIKKRD